MTNTGFQQDYWTRERCTTQSYEILQGNKCKPNHKKMETSDVLLAVANICREKWKKETLFWLHVHFRIDFEILLFVFGALNELDQQ